MKLIKQISLTLLGILFTFGLSAQCNLNFTLNIPNTGVQIIPNPASTGACSTATDSEDDFVIPVAGINPACHKLDSVFFTSNHTFYSDLDINWILRVRDDVGGDFARRLTVTLSFSEKANIQAPATTMIFPLAPGSCTPSPLACIVPNTVCPFVVDCPADTTRQIYYRLTPLPVNACIYDLALYTLCPSTGIVLPNADTFNITW